ncbi:hypothetical protein GGR53DRAFT_386439 [Hypoxylon sp. FL1150]|nr:hypothetical protein GGR53DRAFT_386439 [Hypoxylon sp. FL1150]
MFPLPSQVHFIWQTFIERIDPLVKVLHVPSTTRVLEGCRGQIRTLCPDMQSLFACISFAAIQSMSDDDVLLNFGTDKVSLSSRYRRGAEQALSNADVINTTNLAPVQALTIYLNVLHADEPFRHVWAVIGILVRVALSLGLHRDGKFFKNISPFDAEMRRRLWWNVAILDARVGETQVSIAVICQAMFTTEAPANVDDADIHPGMTAPAVSRRGPTDVSILLGRCKIWRFGRALKGLSLDTAVIKGEVDGRQIYERKLEITRKFKKDMVEEYAATFHGDAGASAFIWAIIDVLTDRIELMAHYQFSLVEKQGSSFPHEAFRVALSIVERFHRIENDPDMAKWSWAAKGSVQWQAIGIILSHLCDVPWDEESEKAWQLIDYSFQDMVKAVTKEPLWKPFRRLFLRAKACRKRFSQIQNQDQTNQNQTQKTRDKGAVDTGQEGEWSGLVSRSAYSTTQSTYSTTVDVQGTIAGGTNGNEQRTDTTCISSAHSFQVINEDMGIGVTSLANGDNECGMAIDGSDIGPMDTNDWQQWNDWLQEGFWSFSGI